MFRQIKRDRPVAETENRVTKEMASAGAAILRTYVTLGADFEDLAILTFTAMLEAKATRHREHSSRDDCLDQSP